MVNQESVRRPLGRPPKSQDQRQRILREAAKAMASVGYEQCSLASIAEQLDLTPPALYHYFPTKQSIFSEIAMSTVKSIFEYVQGEIDINRTSGEQLQQMMIAHAEYFDDNYWMMIATIAGYGGITRREIEHLKEFEAYRSRYEKMLLAILRGGVRNGEFSDIDIDSVARSILQLLNITRWYRPGGSKNAADFAAESFDLVYRSLVAHDVEVPTIKK